MTPQELKTSILWNAIQGKLTIQAMGENATNLMKNGLLPEPNIEEQYFDIPANWRWCRIKDLFALVNGKAFKPSDWGTTGIPIVRIQNLNDPAAPYNYFSGDIEDKYVLHGGELLFSWSGTPGTSFGSYIWHGNKAVLNQHIFIVSPQIELDVQYAMYALNAELTVFIEKAHGGAGLKHITKKEFESCGLPIPPLAEQKRIVAKIEELLPLVERYAAAYEKLEQFNAKFPEDMKKSILQYAIQGKLVEQRPEEGTGEELYQQIQTEKQQLIQEKKIKKEKPLPEIAEDEVPFDIPESWKWVRLQNIATALGDGIHGTPQYTINGGYYFINGNNLAEGKIEIKPDTKQVDASEYEKHKKPLDANTILISINPCQKPCSCGQPQEVHTGAHHLDGRGNAGSSGQHGGPHPASGSPPHIGGRTARGRDRRSDPGRSRF